MRCLAGPHGFVYVLHLASRLGKMPHIWGCAPWRGAMTPKIWTGRNFGTMHLPPSFIILCLLVWKLSCWRTHKQTHKQMPLKTSNALRYATTLGKNNFYYCNCYNTYFSISVRNISVSSWNLMVSSRSHLGWWGQHLGVLRHLLTCTVTWCTHNKVLPRLSWAGAVHWLLTDDETVTVANTGFIEGQVETVQSLSHRQRKVTFKNHFDIVVYVEYTTHFCDDMF